MHHFSIVDVGTNALMIQFIMPYDKKIYKDLDAVFKQLGAVTISSGTNPYNGTSGSWMRIGEENFSFDADYMGAISIYAQGNNETIAKIENALIASKLFQKVPIEN
jgi:hypothetical protein